MHKLNIGVSVYPDDSRDVDTAMYQAKASGRNNYKYFCDDMATPGVRRMFVR